MPEKVSKSVPKGLAPKGSTRGIRGKPNHRAATDIPMEVPVYVGYERHIKSEAPQGESSYALNQLLGWTITLDCWTFGTKVYAKIYRGINKGDPQTLEIWVHPRDGKPTRAFRQTTNERSVGEPPVTEPDADYSIITLWMAGADLPESDGWVTRLGKTHAAEKATEQRKTGHKPIKEKSKITRFDDDDEILWEDEPADPIIEPDPIVAEDDDEVIWEDD